MLTLSGTEEDAIENDQEPAIKVPAKPKPNLVPNVVSDLKQLDGGQQIEKVPGEEGNSVVGENLNIGRLGMGGLKALEKINNLIKASAESQEGEEGGSENSLTDEQAQAIERMIIEGIHRTKKKSPDGSGTQRTSIPRRKNGITKAFPKLKQAVRRKGVPLTLPGKPIPTEKKDTKVFPTPVEVGVPRLQIKEPKEKGTSSSNQVEEKNEDKVSSLNGAAQGPGKMRPIPVVRTKFDEERKKASPEQIRGLGLGIAGTGNSP